MDIDLIERFHPCSEAQEWLTTQSSPEEAWNACVRGDWMGWLITRIGNSELIQAIEPAWKAYNEARVTAWKANGEVCVTAWKAWANDIRKVVRFEDVMKALVQ